LEHGVRNAGGSHLLVLAFLAPPLDEEESVAEPYKIIAKVISVHGTCEFGHTPGDKVAFDGETIEGRICLHALYSFLPKVFAMRYGADFPWLDANHKDVATHACPDACNPVVFEISRVQE
jgi:uncharacterized repeat protein (TIGR04076 family)